MTAEVIVMNKSAIALAADSKVTVGGLRTGKTYDKVNKLFTLSKYHPVGAMIYGNAEFMDSYLRQYCSNMHLLVPAVSSSQDSGRMNFSQQLSALKLMDTSVATSNCIRRAVSMCLEP